VTHKEGESEKGYSVSFKKRTRGDSMEKADQHFKAKRRGCFLTQCVKMVAA